MSNPYNPTPKQATFTVQATWRATYEQQMVLLPEFEREQRRARAGSQGYQEGRQGLPCGSTDGAYLEGWYEANSWRQSRQRQ